MINHYDNDDNYDDDDEIDDLYSHYQIMTFSYVCCVLMIKISYYMSVSSINVFSLKVKLLHSS